MDASKGVFLIAYPNQDQETEFEFKYWTGPYVEKSGGFNIGIIIAAILFVCAIILMFITIKYRLVKKHEKAVASVLAEETTYDKGQDASAEAVGNTKGEHGTIELIIPE